MSKSDSPSTQPKSIRQKRILDIAADNPGATLAEIADQIPSVSTDHVDRVLDQYGDPASGESGTDHSSSASPDEDAHDDATAGSHDSPGSRTATEATARTDASAAGTDAEPDSPSATDTPATAPQMDPDTDPNPTDPVVEPEAKPEESDEPTEAPGSDADDAASADDVASTDDGADDAASADDDADDATATEETVPDPEDLTQKERETLRAISYKPAATQDQIADMLSISRATVSNRVNAIPGFEWAERGSFVEAVFDEDVTVDASVSTNGDSSTVAENAGKEAVADGASSVLPDQTGGESSPQGPPSASADGGGVDGSETASPDDLEAISDQLEEFAQRLATIEAEVNDAENSEASPLSDTDLLHKVVHACMDSDRITEDEELQILDALTN